MNKTAFLILPLLLCNVHLYGQNMQELIRLHHQNLNALMSLRDNDLWVDSGDVTEGDLYATLNHYRANVGILIYTYSEDSLRLLLLTKGHRKFIDRHAVPKDSLIQSIQHFKNNISKYQPGSPEERRGLKPENDPEKISLYRQVELNRILLPSDDAFLHLDHIIIVPVLNIATLPFAALKLPDGRDLIDAMSFSLAPSLIELKVSEVMNHSGFYDSTKLVFSNALFMADPTPKADQMNQYARLPGTLSEATGITSRMDPSTYTKLTGRDATLKNVMRDICHYDLLYFATHGVADPIHALDSSYLIMSGDVVDNHLTAKMIQKISDTCQLQADIVILSACQTALGKVHDGGMIGLSRAFHIAGAKTVVMSLWDIDDKQTAKFMNYFFNFLQEGGPLLPHGALRNAALKFKQEQNDDPKYWAAFSISGIPF